MGSPTARRSASRVTSILAPARRPTCRVTPAEVERTRLRHETDGVDHVAHPPRASQPVLILMMSLMVSCSAASRYRRLSVDLFPEHRHPGHPRRHLLSRRRARSTSRRPSPSRSSARSASSPGVDRVESTSKQGASIVSVWFNYGTNLDNAQFEVQQRVAQILNTLPPGIQQPYIIKFDITNIPVVQVVDRAATGSTRSSSTISRYNVIEPQLERLPGVASATRRRRQDARDPGQGRPRGAARARPRHPRRGQRGARRRTCSCRAATCAPAIATTTSSPTPSSTSVGRSSDVVVRPGTAALARHEHAAVRVARHRAGRGRHGRSERSRPHQRQARRLHPRPQAARAPTPSPWSTRSGLRCRTCAAFRRT